MEVLHLCQVLPLLFMHLGTEPTGRGLEDLGLELNGGESFQDVWMDPGDLMEGVHAEADVGGPNHQQDAEGFAIEQIPWPLGQKRVLPL